MLTEKNPKRIFTFMKKGKKGKWCSTFASHSTITEATCTQSSMNGTAKLLPKELHWASKHQASRALNYVCNHLCSVSVYFVHLLARWVLRYQKSLRTVIFSTWKCSKLFPYKLTVTASSFLFQFQLMKGFTGMLYFW